MKLVVSGIFFSFIVISVPYAAAEDLPAGMSLSLGYRVDALDWNINGAGNQAGSEPNILSELEWRDMDILQLKARFNKTNRDGYYFRGSFSYGWAMDGENQDSDYAGDNRSLEFSRSLSDIDDSTVMDLGGGLGYTLFLGANEDIRLIPIVGYSYHRQELNMRNGNQILWNSANAAVYNPGIVGSVPLGPFSGLNSSYDAHWSGPWLGVDLIMDLQTGSTFFARVEAHKANYFAEANWNLRSDFAHPVSFEHEADGYGWVLELGWMKELSRHYWSWGVTTSFQSWSTDAGTDRTFFADNSYSEGRLNEVNWTSSNINFTLSKSFYD